MTTRGEYGVADRVEILGYRRLLKVSAYVGRKAVALVGPNEAGKSSVLSALRLFDTDDPVPAIDSTRSRADMISIQQGQLFACRLLSIEHSES